MVTASINNSNKGNLLHLLSLREIRDGVLCLRAPTNQNTQREYMAVVQVDPANLTLMDEGDQEATLEGFRSFLATLSPNEKALSIHCRTSKYDIQPYIDKLFITAVESKSEYFQKMAIEHKNFILKLAHNKALIQREFYVRIPIAINLKEGRYRRLLPAEVFEQVRADLARRTWEVINGLMRAGLVAHRMDSEELVQYYLSCVHKRNAETFKLPPGILATLDFPPRSELPHVSSHEKRSPSLSRERPTDGAASETQGNGNKALSVKRWIWKSSKQIQDEKKKQEKKEKNGTDPIPDLISLPELIQPASVEQTPDYIKIHHTVGNEYLRAQAVVGYPAHSYGGWFDQLLSIDKPDIEFLMFIESISPVRYVRSLTRSISGYRATQHVEQRHGRTEDPYIARARTEAEDLRDKLVQKTEQIHNFSLYICSRAETRQGLKERDAKVTSLIQSIELQSVPFQYQHLQVWQACLDARDLLKRGRKFDTSTIVGAFPFCSSNISTEPGSLVGLTSGGGMVIIDPTSDQLENGHELVFARSGAGKSYYRKIDLMRSLLTGFHAIVLDPDREEYYPVCQQFGGSYIRLSPGHLAINPFDIARLQGVEHNSVVERNPLEEKLQSLLVLFDLLLADKSPGVLSQREKGYLNKQMRKIYAECGITADRATHEKEPPNMQMLYELMVEEGDTFGLCDRLLRYLPNFPVRTKVDLTNRLMVFSINGLPEDLQPVALYLVTEFVWTQARKDKVPDPRMLLIDEAWILMAFPEGGRFLAGISRKARKYNLHLKFVTHNVEDFLASEDGRTILQNASQKFLMKQDSTTIDAVVKAFKLSNEERKFLLGASKGEGLYYSRSSHVPLQVIASEVEDQLARTDPKELMRQEQARLREQATKDAITQGEAIALPNEHNKFNNIPLTVYKSNPEVRNNNNGNNH